jgi:hypothetical protein
MTQTRRDTGAWIRRVHPSDAPARPACLPPPRGVRGEPCVGDLAELARRLEHEGATLSTLFVSGHEVNNVDARLLDEPEVRGLLLPPGAALTGRGDLPV